MLSLVGVPALIVVDDSECEIVKGLLTVKEPVPDAALVKPLLLLKAPEAILPL